MTPSVTREISGCRALKGVAPVFLITNYKKYRRRKEHTDTEAYILGLQLVALMSGLAELFSNQLM